MALNLWLVRHARPLVGDGVCYGALDVPADPAATAAAAAALVAQLPGVPLELRVSPRRRCMQLAQALQALRPQWQPQPDARLAEMDFGEWEGRRWDALDAQALADWTADFPDYRCGGGEHVAGFMARVADAWQQALRAPLPQVWITHAGVIRAVQLLRRGVAVPRCAAEWPADAPAPGACWKLTVASG